MVDRHLVVAKASLLIRKPVSDVFAAFVDATTLTRFWLARASGSLEEGKTVHWEFMVPGATVDTHVRRLVNNERIEIDWSDGTFVTWNFTSTAEGTIVAVENGGFKGSAVEVIVNALESTQGFTIVLCDLKTLLETGRSTSLVRDKAALIQQSLNVTS